MFGAAKSKLRDIRFDRVDCNNPREQQEALKYNVRFLPKVVILDRAGEILFAGLPPMDSAEQFQSMVMEFR